MTSFKQFLDESHNTFQNDNCVDHSIIAHKDLSDGTRLHVAIRKSEFPHKDAYHETEIYASDGHGNMHGLGFHPKDDNPRKNQIQGSEFKSLADTHKNGNLLNDIHQSHTKGSFSSESDLVHHLNTHHNNGWVSTETSGRINWKK